MIVVVSACSPPTSGHDSGNGGGVEGGGAGGGVTLNDAVPSNNGTSVPTNTPFYFDVSGGTASATLELSPTLKVNLYSVPQSEFAVAHLQGGRLAYGITYSGSIVFKNDQGNVVARHPYAFTTLPDPFDITRPTLEMSTPSFDAGTVALDAGVTLRFSEPVDSVSFTASIIDGGIGAATWTTDRTEVSLAPPSEGFLPGRTHVLAWSATDSSGNVGSGTLRFTTAGAAGPPTVAAMSPIPGATFAPTNARVAIAFSEAMNTTSVGSSITIVPPVSCTWMWAAGSDQIAACNPSAPLTASTQYSVTVGTGAMNRAGVPLASPFTASFTTGSGATETTPPTLVAVTPTTGATGIDRRRSSIVFQFSEPMDLFGTSGALSVINGGALNLLFGDLLWNADARQLRYTYRDTFPATVDWSFTAAAKDVAGNSIAMTSGTFATESKTGSETRTATDVVFLRQSGRALGMVEIVYLGDDALNRQRAAMLQFSLSSLPTNLSRITRARLVFEPHGCHGQPSSLGPLLVESLPTPDPPDGLAAQAVPSERTTHVFTCNPSQRATQTDFIDVTNKVQSDWVNLATRQKSTFRLRFDLATNSNGVADRLIINTEPRPTLVIDYERL